MTVERHRDALGPAPWFITLCLYGGAIAWLAAGVLALCSALAVK